MDKVIVSDCSRIGPAMLQEVNFELSIRGRFDSARAIEGYAIEEDLETVLDQMHSKLTCEISQLPKLKQKQEDEMATQKLAANEWSMAKLLGLESEAQNGDGIRLLLHAKATLIRVLSKSNFHWKTLVSSLSLPLSVPWPEEKRDSQRTGVYLRTLVLRAMDGVSSPKDK